MLVKSIFQRRFWWNQEDDYKKVNVAWTQLKIPNFFDLEVKSAKINRDSKLDSNIKTESPRRKKIMKNVSEIKPKAGFKPPFPPEK